MTTEQALRTLARAAGIQLAYRDIAGQRQVARPEQLIAVLQALGLPIEHPDQAPQVLREYQHQRLQRVCEPVHVWVHGLGHPSLRILTSQLPEGTCTVHVRCEDGATEERTVPAADIPMAPQPDTENASLPPHYLMTLSLPLELPIGGWSDVYPLAGTHRLDA